MKNKYSRLMIWAAIILPLNLMAQPKQVEASNPQAIALMIIAAILAVAIYITAKLLVQQAKINLKKIKKSAASKLLPVLLFMLLSNTLPAQDVAATGNAATVTGLKTTAPLSSASFYVLIAVISVEIIILISLIIQVKALIGANEETTIIQEAPAIAKEKSFSLQRIWQKLNRFKPIREEADIDLGHDYDGIRELDNRLPPWWLYGFYACIIFACVYLWRFHVSHTGPSSLQELQIAMQQAQEQRDLYLARAKNNVDENTVTPLEDAADLEAGKKVFTTMCAACHAADGGGGVGPNLTDAYWLHGGGIKNIFKTITYGWPDKGMKSWKDDYSPLQIQQIASYVLSLHGTKPATPKEPQGELYKERHAATDSSAVKDSATKTITAFVR